VEAIWKQSLECAEHQVVSLPRGSKVLCVQTQREQPCIWFVTPETNNPTMELRTFAIHGTGHECVTVNGIYIGTFQLQGGALVFHVFEEK